MPFYQFNSFTGSLKPVVNQLQPLYPIKTETVMRYDSVKTKPVITSPVSSYCTDKPSTVSAKLWSHYKLFEKGIAAGKSTHVMFGRRDVILYRFAASLVAFCTMNTAYFAAKHVFNII
ncbi:hypothetical protein HN011_000337 [Eciton burchellii]|nr:hypothetical protein HN011_000337 [Eciton burchellii]